MENVVVRIDDLARGGAGVAKLPDGRVAFVPWTAPGDQVSIHITKDEKNYVHAEVVEWIEKSPKRVEPRCPVFTKCGGCNWQHIDYDTQWERKKSGAIQTLKRGGTDASTIPQSFFPAEKIWNYRNRIQLRGENGTLGFFQKNTTNQVPIDHCDIADPAINAAIPALKAEAKEKFQRSYKLEVSVTDGKVKTAWNQKHSALGFDQVHEEQNAALKKYIASQLKDQNQKESVLLDLFGGRGNLSDQLWNNYSQTHIVDFGAKAPKQEKATFWPDSVLFWLKNGARKSIPKDTNCHVILDPPREGLGNDHEDIHTNLARFKVQKLIHVGCDADSFTRDLSRWVQYGYEIQSLAFFDMFPQTIHIESVAVLVRRACAEPNA